MTYVGGRDGIDLPPTLIEIQYGSCHNHVAGEMRDLHLNPHIHLV